MDSYAVLIYRCITIGGVMPRISTVKNQSNYMGYLIKDKYAYNEVQLIKIIKALEFYHKESLIDLSSNYVAFDITIKVNDTTASPYYEPVDDDNGLQQFFDVNDMKDLLPDEHFFYRWTREWSKKNKEHYHFVVIANHVPRQDYLPKLQQDISNLVGVKSAYISPRLLADNDHRGCLHFHWLGKEPDAIDGLDDAVNRHSYKAKLDQKLDGVKRTFDGCRVLKPLVPLSKRLHSLSLASA